MKTLLVLLALTFACGCQTLVLTGDGVAKYPKEDVRQGKLFISQCHVGYEKSLGSNLSAKELGKGQMVISYCYRGEPKEAYYFAFYADSELYLVIDADLSEHLAELNAIDGLQGRTAQWQARTVSEIAFRGIDWTKVSDKFTVVAIPTNDPSKATLCQSLCQMISLGWLSNVTNATM